MQHDVKQIILANYECKAQLNTCISQHSAATDLTGGASFNSSFFCSSFPNSTVTPFWAG